MHSTTTKALLGGAIAAGMATAMLAGSGAAGASTSPGAVHVVKQYADSYFAPLQIAVGNGKIYVADSAQSALFRLGDPTPIAHGDDPSKGGGLDGVGINRETGDIAYTQTNAMKMTSSVTILHDGHATRSSDLAAYERINNPDGNVQYGAVGPTNSCQRKALQQLSGLPAKYKGVIESHPYAVNRLLHNNWAVADAAGNDVLRVDSAGHVSTLAVLPAVPFTFTKEFVQENSGPSCLIGLTYRFESVPTDAELGPDGDLYVTTLPGGEIPNSGQLYKIDIHSRKVTLVAGGFNLAVNLAVTPSGDAYVAELGSGDIKYVHDGQVSTAANLPAVVSLQYVQGMLYASTAPGVFDGKTPGHVYRLAPGAASN